MVQPVILYSESTGSDTAASGAGPATAVTGSSATNGAGNIVILDGTPDLSGVAVDDMLYATTAAGVRHLSQITAVNDGADTVTTEDLLALGGGVVWAIGGKRKTLTGEVTRNDLDDAKAGWDFEFDSGTYLCLDHGSNILTGFPATLAAGGVTVRASSSATTRPILTWTGEVSLFDLFSDDLVLEGMACSNTTATTTDARCVKMQSNSSIHASDCTFDANFPISVDASTVILTGGSITSSGEHHGIQSFNESYVELSNVDVSDCDIGVFRSDGVGALHLLGCRIHGCSSQGVNIAMNGTSRGYSSVTNTVCHGNSSDGLLLSGTVNISTGHVEIVNNIFSSNGGRGISAGSNVDLLVLADFNAFHNNTSGALNNISAGANDVTLTADPFIDSASGDFRLNREAGGGTLLKAQGLGFGDWNIGAEQGVRRRVVQV